MQNPCMGAKTSCSACCGIFNLKANDAERHAWVAENTELFLKLDISHAENIVAYRKEREAVTLPNRVREDIYVCPFVGYVDGADANGGSVEPDASMRTVRRADAIRGSVEPDASMRTGCLLHPQGSPHPQINLWEHPQNFSFYGEGICLAYDCLAKERQVYRADFFVWAETVSALEYGRLASDHTLHRTLATLPLEGKDLHVFYSALAGLYAEYQTVTTSFEDIEKALPESAPELCRFLAVRINATDIESVAELLLSSISTSPPNPLS